MKIYRTEQPYFDTALARVNIRCDFNNIMYKVNSTETGVAQGLRREKERIQKLRDAQNTSSARDLRFYRLMDEG
jgi:hypothetical protein